MASLLNGEVGALWNMLNEKLDALRIEIQRGFQTDGNRSFANQKSSYTTKEFAERMCVTAWTVRRWIRDGKIQAHKVAGSGPKGRHLIPREQLQRVLAHGESASPS